jgi:hypothetical protein
VFRTIASETSNEDGFWVLSHTEVVSTVVGWSLSLALFLFILFFFSSLPLLFSSLPLLAFCIVFLLALALAFALQDSS